MIRFETVNELALQVTCQGGGVLYTKAGAFIAGESAGGKNYTFEKVLLGPQQGLLQAAFGVLTRRVAGENLPLMKVNFSSIRSERMIMANISHISAVVALGPIWMRKFGFGCFTISSAVMGRSFFRTSSS